MCGRSGCTTGRSGTYPGSIEQLEKTNNIRFLRQQYVDPMTGKADWRLIQVGEAKTTVKGFFGQPLAGLATGPGAGTGSPIGSNNTGATGATGAYRSVWFDFGVWGVVGVAGGWCFVARWWWAGVWWWVGIVVGWVGVVVAGWRVGWVWFGRRGCAGWD